MMDKVDEIIEEARNSIGEYCEKECKAFCCRNGSLVITKNEMGLISGFVKDKKDLSLFKKLKNNKYSLYMGNHDNPCPCLGNDFRCRIHKDKLRPQACRDFPISRYGDRVLVSGRCLAVRENQIYPYLRQLSMMGLRITESGTIFQSGFWMNDYSANKKLDPDGMPGV